jgi:hypothetical protein
MSEKIIEIMFFLFMYFLFYWVFSGKSLLEILSF